MTLGDSIEVCLRKYADFNGRASRPEFWWWLLFVLLSTTGADIVSESLGELLALVTLLPTLAVTARRLHDTNRSGWGLLLLLLPVLGCLIILFLCTKDAVEPNRFDSGAMSG